MQLDNPALPSPAGWMHRILQMLGQIFGSPAVATDAPPNAARDAAGLTTKEDDQGLYVVAPGGYRIRMQPFAGSEQFRWGDVAVGPGRVEPAASPASRGNRFAAGNSKSQGNRRERRGDRSHGSRVGGVAHSHGEFRRDGHLAKNFFHE